jgi:RNA polymerase sigma factor (sigma-70 family)
MELSAIENHFNQNRARYVKKFTFKTGTVEDAEDIVQEAYCRLLKYHHSFHGKEFDRWFNMILNNCFYDLKNNQAGNYAEVFDEEAVEGTSCPHYSDQVMREVYELISTKSLVQQEILGLYFEHEYSAVDISRCTEHSYANAHQVIRRFRQELKELYG